MIGNNFGKWIVLKEFGMDYKSNQLVLCRCVCGIEKPLRKSTLISGQSNQCKKCRMTEFNKTDNIVGLKIGNAIVLRRIENLHGNSCYLIRCDCGNEKKALGYRLKAGLSTKCPHCRVKKHGMSCAPTYKIWQGMLARCFNPRLKAFKYYGGRGITVCERWLKFENFLEDMGERPGKLSIDRINNDGNYEKDNCRWATSIVQMSNRRRSCKK